MRNQLYVTQFIIQYKIVYTLLRGTKYIAEALKINKSVTNLSSSYKNVGNYGINFLLKSIKTNNIKKLKLTSNKYGDIGNKYIAKMIKSNNALEILFLYYMVLTNTEIDGSCIKSLST